MSILDELTGLEIKEDIVVELKNETLPLVMWGIGELATEIIAYLQENYINIDDIFVDENYYREHIVFHNFQVHTYEYIQRKYETFNIIIGHSNYEKAAIMEKRKEINKVFCLFSVNYNVFTKTSIEDIIAHSDEFEKVYDLFEDDESKNNYLALLKTRISGNVKYVLDVFKHEMNFFNNDVFVVSEQECYMDIGAYDGDTIRLFLQECHGKYDYIYALEPDEKNREKLEKYIKEQDLKNVIVTDKGAWKEKDTLRFLSNNEQISSVANQQDEENDVLIYAEPIDTMFAYAKKVTLLKINYLSGVEEALLGGGQHILREHMPKLAITVGFNCENIRIIPQLIKEINPQYKLYLRYNRGMVSSLTLYATVL